MEALGDEEGGDDKSEYSLTQHLANNLIDMYINLPSKNNYRRPATYASKGYRTRRMAVDFAVPLITNVKVAKLLVEALVRKMPLNVSTVDAKTSHVTHIFPGLVNIAAFVPDLSVPGSSDIVEATKAALSAGFTTSLVIPLGYGNEICDRETLDQARANISASSAYGNYALSVTASPTNAKTLNEELQADVKSLFVPFVPGNVATQVSVVAAHFASWPVDKPIVTNAKGSDLASVLLVASLNSRSVHISDVQNKEDLMLIKLSKAKRLKVTCDVSVYTLFFARNQFAAKVKALPTADDQAFIWQNLDAIDAFTVNGPPFYVSVEQGKNGSPWSGVEESLPLLLTAVAEGRLTLQDVQERFHDNPIRIFGLPEQAHTQVEVVVNRSFIFPKRGNYWSPISGRPVKGAVHRVILHGQTVFLDGAFVAVPNGKDISAAAVSHAPENPVASLISSLSSTQLAAPSTAAVSKPTQIEPSVGPTTSLLVPARAQQTLTHVVPHAAFHRRHILSVKQFTQRDIYDLFSLAHEMRLQVERSGAVDILRGKVLCTLFYEPSTRTSASFEAAMKRCGGDVVSVTADRCSVQKGETLQDTIRTLGCYGDAIVLRHPDVGSAQLAAKYSPVPVLNAGDGTGEHPTQALLDVYTIRSELGTVNGRCVTLIGDLKNGRTVHSLVTLLCLYSVRLNFVSPVELAMPATVVSAARKAGVPVYQCESLEEVLAETDVLYVTRVQRERFADEREWERVKDIYRVDHAVLSRAKEDVIVMHPLPRLNGKRARPLSALS